MNGIEYLERKRKQMWIPEPKNETPIFKDRIPTVTSDFTEFFKSQMNSYEEYRKYWQRLAEAHDCTCLTDVFVQLNELKELNEALESRCKVAEDLNKIYVRMYLEMQNKYDKLAAACW